MPVLGLSKHVLSLSKGDDLLWLRHHIDEADMSLRRNEPQNGSLSLRSSRSSLNPQIKNPQVFT